MVTDAQAQAAAVTALHRRYQTAAVFTAMDLSAEAEAFGCTVHLSDHEVPTVTSRLIRSRADIEALTVPRPGRARTGIYLEAARRVRGLPGGPAVLGWLIGPFSLAARLYGVSEMLGVTLEDPELAHRLVGRAAAFVRAYAGAFRDVGASGVVLAEPTAGLLSPRGLEEFSSAYLMPIVSALQTPDFVILLHNCAARPVHLRSVFSAGPRVCHFGAPIDLKAALAQAPDATWVGGNLDPSRRFVQGTPEQVRAATRKLLAAAAGRPRFVLSSGCDLPPQTPLANGDAFFEATRAFSESRGV